MRMKNPRGRLLPPLAVLVFFRAGSGLKIIFYQAVVNFFASDARVLQATRIFQERWCSGHQLAGATRCEHHIGKLAFRSFGLHSHFSLSLQMTPEDFPPPCAAAHWSTATRLQSLPLRGPRAPHPH